MALLNSCTANVPVALQCDGAIPWTDAQAHAGEKVIAEGPVVSTFFASDATGQPTFLNIGNDHPNPNRLTAIIWLHNRDLFPSPPEDTYAGEVVCVSGMVELYEGVPEIEIESPSDIWVGDDQPSR